LFPSHDLAAFNKRIEPLLVVFSPEIRNDILIDDPEKRPLFTKKQSELVRGFPRKEGDQDYLDEVLTLSDSEIEFWNSVGINPYYMYIDDTLERVEDEYVQKNLSLVNIPQEFLRPSEDIIYQNSPTNLSSTDANLSN